jgi:thiosulfate/3-mercaptopyruvate sulfurtransferase
MLDDLGHPDVAVLDGGLEAWTAAGLPLTTDEPHWPGVDLALADRWTNVIERDELTRRLGSVVLLDARAPERYRGEVEPIDPAAGHIPTALNAPLGENVDQTGRFRPPDELASRFRALGADRGTVVTSCGSGTNACQNALAMRLAGLPDPLLYPGSFSDWSRSGMPVAVGPEPGMPPSA